MKTVISIISIILCVAVIFIGQLHWNNKTSDSTSQSEVRKDRVNSNNVDKVSVSELDSILAYTKNWPAESVNTLKSKLEAGKSFKITILGSSSQGEGKESWPEMVKTSFEDTFGKNITVSSLSYDLTSLDYVNEDKVTEVIKEQPDLILFEPFTLKDNGAVSIDDSLENTSSIIAEVKESLPNTVFILQPPHPLYNATYYPLQVEKLQQFAEDNEIPYVNHWDAWPSQASEEITEYLNEDSSQPSPKGHKLWADYLISYFIAE